MKRLRITTTIPVFLLFCLNGLLAQSPQTQPNQVLIGSIETIYSKILNEQRRILVYIPASASSEIYTKQRYPVVYLLDGDAGHFSSVVGMIRRLSSNYVCPEMIVVGILNIDRGKDFTPTHMNSFQFKDWVDSISIKKSGGGENFASFLKNELIPHVDSLYSTAPYRMLFGHSLGGLAVMNILIHHSNLFRSYVAIDPAMGWDNQILLKEAKEVLANNSYSGISLFLGIPNTMKAGMDTIIVKKDISKSTEQIRSVFELRDYFISNRQNQLKFAYKYYENDNHTSVPLITEYDALRFIFDCYQFDFFSDDYKNLESIYENISKHFGYKVKPPEGMVNFIGNTFLSFKHFDKAIFVFRMNVSIYPESYNVYNSLGDYYVAKADKASAADNFKKSLSIKEVPAVRQKLEKLQQK